MSATSSNPASTASPADFRRRDGGRAATTLLFAVTLTLAGCSAKNPYYDATRPHHRPDGFVNSDPAAEPPPLPVLEQIRRMLTGYYRPLAPPKDGYEAFARAWSTPVDRAYLGANRDETALTWLGHASMLLQVDGRNVLIDPMFSERASPLPWGGSPRRVAPPLAVADLPAIDTVLISHNHYDHLDRPTVLALIARFPQLRFLVPLGLKSWLEDAGAAHVDELDWWETRTDGPLRIVLTPAQHWSKRTPWDRNRSLWGGFLIASARAPGWRFLYTGDTGYSQDFTAIRERLGPIDFVALPVGAYEPRDFMRNQHLNPDDAVRVVLDLQAAQALGVHWGTFELTHEAFDQPPADLATALSARGVDASRLRLLKHGETWRIPRPAP